MTGHAEQDAVTSAVAANLAAVRERIAAAARAVGRAPAEVTLVAVSKAQPDARVLAALAAGQRVFGENYVQEARARWPALRARHQDLQLHMIGPIQTNKAKDVVALFDVIETVDRPKLARVLAERDRAPGPPARLLRPGQHRRGGAEGRGLAWRCGRLHQGLPGRSRPAGRRPDGDPAGGRGAVPALRAARQDRRDATG